LKSETGYWHGLDPSLPDPPVYERGTGNGTVQAAEIRGYVGDGGLYVSQLESAAHAIGFHTCSGNARSARPPTVADLRWAVKHGLPPVISFLVDDHGCPTAIRDPDNNSHFAVIEGFYTAPDGTEYVVAKHGWSDRDFAWKLSDFEASWKADESTVVLIAPDEKTLHPT
jgi:hypothetical protein